jgi:hypothetical protein
MLEQAMWPYSYHMMMGLKTGIFREQDNHQIDVLL